MTLGPLDVLKDVVQRFENTEIEYFLVGSLASMYYGRPRFTNDVDLVVKINACQAFTFENLFDLEDYYCPPHEIISDEVLRGGSFNLIHQASGIKIDIVLLKKSVFYQTEFSRRRKVQLLPDFTAYIASPEDIIIKKLDFYREGESEKHLIDIRGIVLETEIDKTYLNEWIVKLGLTEEWKKAEQG